MTNQDGTTVIGTAPTLHPKLPCGDDPAAITDVLAAILAMADASSTALNAIATCHVKDAPATAAHVLVLREALALTLLTWFSEWPS